MKKAILILGFFIGIIFKIDAQIEEVKYLIEYNDTTGLYDCKIVIIEGEATTYPQRIQFNSQYSIVVPTGTTLTIDTLYNPKEKNQFYTGTVPCLWEFGPKEFSPPAQPEHDFHTVFPNLSPPSAYDDLFPGDTVTLFSVSADLDPCENAIRLFENGTDPSSLYMPSGGDFSCGHTFGGGPQVYSGNLTSEYGNNYISKNDTLSICYGECITLEPNISCLDDDLKYEWSTGDTTATIEVCPTEPTNYTLTLRDSSENVLDIIPVLVDFDPLYLGPQNVSICAGSTVTLSSCTSNVTWSQSSANGFGLSLAPLAGGEVEATISSFASGTYDIVCSVQGFSDTLQITAIPAPLVNISSAEICVGGSTIAAPNIVGGTWVSNTPAIAGIDAITGVINGYSQGAVTFTYTSSDGCTATTNPLLVTLDIDAQFTGPDSICIGTTTTLSPNSGGSWNSSDNSVATTTNGGVVMGTGPGVAFLEYVENGSGCRSNPIMVTVEAEHIELTGPVGICIGETTSFSSESVGTWSSSDPSIATIDPNSGLVTGVGSGYATFTFTNTETNCQSLPSEKIYVSSISYIAIEDLEICVGETTQLNSDAEGTWVSDSPLIAIVHPTTGSVTGMNAGFVSFTLTNEFGCSLGSFPLQLTVLPKTEVEIMGPSVICSGSTTNLFPNTGGTWASSNTAVTVVDNFGTVTGVASGSSIMTYTDMESGCTSDGLKITVIDDSYIPTAYNNGPVCEGEDIILATGFLEGATYEWTGPNGYVSADQNPVISNATFADQGSYCLIVSIDGCVSAEACTHVTINYIPDTPLANNNGPLCEGEDIELTTFLYFGAIYEWTGPGGFSSNLQNPIIVGGNASASGTYCVSISINGCESLQGCTDVYIKPTPDTPVISNNSPLCEGKNLQLTTQSVTNATYSWTGPNGFSSGDQNPILSNITPSDAGNYCVIVTVDGCDSQEECSEVNINSSNYTPIASNNGPLCEGDHLVLETESIAGATYAWSGPNSYSSTDQNPTIPNASLLDAGIYSVIITTDGCESGEGYTEVVVNSKPNTPFVSNNGPICEGEDLELSSEIVVAALYEWTGPAGFSATGQSPFIIDTTPSESGAYCVVVTVDGCSSDQSCTDVIVNPIPVQPVADNNGPVCEGEDLELTTDAVVGATYSWSGPNGFSSSLRNPILIGGSPSEGGTYCVIVTVDGCSSHEGCTDVIINPTPNSPVATNNGPICEGEDLELTVNASSGATYAWTGPNGFASTDQNPVITGASLASIGNYCVIVTIDGCVSEESCTWAFINSAPEMPIISSNSPICEGGYIELSTGFVEGATYTWADPNGFELLGQYPLFPYDFIPVAGTYSLVVTVDGCESEAAYTDVIIHPRPDKPVVESNGPICKGEDLELTTNAVAGGIYQWSGPNGFSSSDQNLVINQATSAENGYYCVIVTVDDCKSESTCIEVNVASCIDPLTSCDQITADDIICDYNDLANISGILSDQISNGNQPPGHLCDSDDGPQNVSWFGFVALEGDYEIIINSSDCTNNNGSSGMKIGVYSSCEFIEENVVFCETSFNSNIQTRIASSFFTPGQTYYLYIDGYEGSICDYSIDVEGFYDNTYCTDLSKVTGVAYIDDNENGIYDEGETLLRNALISLSPGNFSVLTNDEGKYIINTPKGGATLTAKMNEGHWINDELTIEDLTIFETCVEGIDFGFVPNLFYQEASISVANTVTRCDWETQFYFTVENTGTIDLDAKFEFEFDSKTSYFASNLIGIQVNDNVASGNLGVIEPFEVKGYWIKLKMPSGSSVLPVLDFKTTLYNSSDMEMDSYIHSEQLRCSYDPNDKRESPNREGEENLTLMDEDLEYTIRFQNNGNDTAFQVRIVDPLDPNIEPTSIRVINSSHPVETCIENENLIFIFENINLVDSMTNYDGSQGFVSFRCDTKEGRAENTIVNNTADIIFDTNEPIITNTTINTLVSELCSNVTTEIDIEICEGEDYNGYDETGTYTEIYPLQYGCDSMIVINLEVQGITYSSQEIEICEGEVFELNGSDYILYESQEIKDTMTNDFGCISNIFIFEVMVNPVVNIDVDTTICEGLEYNGLTTSGIYTIDSFDINTGCDIITTIDLEVLPMSDPSCIVDTEDLLDRKIKIYPNPANDQFYVEANSQIEWVTIYNMAYQKVDEFNFTNQSEIQEISSKYLGQGLYIVAIKSGDIVLYKKLIIERGY